MFKLPTRTISLAITTTIWPKALLLQDEEATWAGDIRAEKKLNNFHHQSYTAC